MTAPQVEKGRQPAAVRVAQLMFALNAAIWLALGAVSLARMAGSGNAPTITLAVVAILMLGNAGAMLAAGLVLASRRRWALLIALGILVVNIVLTFTDQFGLPDLITLLIDLVLLGLLFASRRLYGSPPAANPSSNGRL